RSHPRHHRQPQPQNPHPPGHRGVPVPSHPLANRPGPGNLRLKAYSACQLMNCSWCQRRTNRETENVNSNKLYGVCAKNNKEPGQSWCLGGSTEPTTDNRQRLRATHYRAKPCDGLVETLFEGDLGLPAEEAVDAGDVGAAAGGVVLQGGHIFNL